MEAFYNSTTATHTSTGTCTFGSTFESKNQESHSYAMIITTLQVYMYKQVLKNRGES